MALFTETFTVQKVNTTDWATYRQFIESTLRGKTDLIFRRTRNNFPILHPEANPATNDRWFDVVIKASSGNTQVKLRIRRSNLYLDGYQMTNQQWLEFGSGSGTHLIPGSTFLGFQGDYNALENAAGQRREKIELGWKSLENAAITLAASTDRAQRARALLVVIQMICESLRFKSITKHLATKFQNYDDGKDHPDKAGPPPIWMMEQQTSWGHISEELLHTDSDPTHRFVPPDPKTGITTATQAWEAIGMLKYFKFPRSSGEGGVKVDAGDGGGQDS